MATDGQIRLEEKIDHLAEKVGLLNILLTGNRDPEKGVIVRLDRAEQTLGRQRKFIWAIVGAVVTQAVSTIKDLF